MEHSYAQDIGLRYKSVPMVLADMRTHTKTPPKALALPIVSIVCGNAYPIFDTTIKAPFGGMEMRSALFGRGLSKNRNWQINFVVSDFGQQFLSCHEGIDFHVYQPVFQSAARAVLPKLRKRLGLPLLSVEHFTLNLLWQIPLVAAWLVIPAFFSLRFWRAMNPSIVCCFGNSPRSAEVIADCGRLGIQTVLCIASDEDISADYQPGNHNLSLYGMPKWKGHYTLLAADCIVAQTETQREIIRSRFGRPSVLIRNPVPVSPNDQLQWLPNEKREFVLWVGRSDNFNKRPLLFLELAKLCPNLEFLMVVNNSSTDIFDAILAEYPANLKIVEQVSPNDIWSLFRRAKVFVNTSNFEGFPNTFLQAGVTGTPIVSLEVDPDGMLSKEGCGICAGGSLLTLKEAVTKLWNDVNKAQAISEICHRYILERHEVDGRIAELENCLEDLKQKQSRRPKPPWWTFYRRLV